MPSKVGFKTFNGGCPGGCFISFNGLSTIQYFPSNTNNYFVVLDGNIRADYGDGSVEVYSNPYSNTWGTYVEPWNYTESVAMNMMEPNDKFLRVITSNITTSQCTFQAATISNEQITKTSDKKCFVYINGSDYSYSINGNNQPILSDVRCSVSVMPAGNTNTYLFSSNSTPTTIVFIEEN